MNTGQFSLPLSGYLKTEAEKAWHAYVAKIDAYRIVFSLHGMDGETFYERATDALNEYNTQVDELSKYYHETLKMFESLRI